MAQRFVSSNYELVSMDRNATGCIGTYQRNKVCLNGLLESTDGRRLEAKVGLEVLGDLTNQTLEGELSDEELGGLLVATDLTESDGTRLVSMGLLDASGRRSRLAGSLGSKLLTRGLATG